MFRKFFTLVIIFVLSSLAVSAQLAEDANACADGGSMEGKCNIDFNGDGEISDYEVSWAWTCGWYMIRYDTGEFSRNQVPVFCSSLLPSEASDSGTDESSVSYCLHQITDAHIEVYKIVDGKYIYQYTVVLPETPPDYPACGPDLPV